jgi:hypothetical protein
MQREDEGRMRLATLFYVAAAAAAVVALLILRPL